MSAEPVGGRDEPAEQRGALGRSTAIMAAGTATSRVLGLVRASVLAAAIGVTAAGSNAFALANWLPNVIYMLIAGGVLNAVLVPQVVRAYRSPGGQEYVDRLLTAGGVVLLGVTAVVTLASPLVVRLASDVEDQSFVALSTAFALWCLPQVFFYGMYTLLGQVLNARGVFGPYMWAPVVNNVVAIAGLVVFIAAFGAFSQDGPSSTYEWWTSGRIAVLGGTATLGVALQALVLLVPLRRIGFRYRPRGGWRGVGLGRAGRVAGWTFGALLIGQLGIFVVTRVGTAAADQAAAGETVAGNAAYNLAFLFFMLPHSLVTVSLLTAMFTGLSSHAAAGEVTAVRGDASYGLRVIGVFTLFATAVLCVLAVPLMRVAFPTVPAAEVAVLAPVLIALVAGLTAFGAWSLVQRVFYAYEDARSLFRIQVPMALVVAGGAWLGSQVLPPRWWTATAGAAIAASYVLGAVWGGVAVRRRLGGTGRRVLSVHLRAGLAALVSAAAGWGVSLLWGDLTRVGMLTAALVCAVVGLVMLAVYAVGLRVLGVTEVDGLAKAVGRLAGPVTRMLAPLTRRPGRPARSMGAQGRDGSRDPDGAPDAQGSHGGDRLDGVVVGRGTLLAGRYRLSAPLTTDLPGVEAWAAQDQILDRPVRTLVLRSGRAREAQDAARRAALVSDPRLLRVLDVGEHEGLPYVVTEPVTGRDLVELTSHGPLPADQARAIIGEAAVALEVARRRGVHHLALRPSSVHVTDDGRVVVSGLALDGVVAGHGVGDARTTTRADTVALVALLYLTLTGRWPVPSGQDAGHAPTAPHVEGAVLPPAELSPAVPNDLDTLCAVTLGPHDDGPHSPAELVRELEPWGPVAAAELFGALDAASEWRRAVGGAAAAGTAAAGAAATAAGSERTGEPGGSGTPGPATGSDSGGATTGGASTSGASTSGAPGDEALTDTAETRRDPGSANGEGTPSAETVVVPATVARTPVRELAGQPGVPLPATPPPAIPPTQYRARPDTSPRSSAVAAALGGAAVTSAVTSSGTSGATSAGTAGATSQPTEAVPAAPPATAPTEERTAVHHAAHAAPPATHPDRAAAASTRPAGPASQDGHEDFDTLIGRSTAVLTEKRFNPAPVVLVLVAIALVIGAIMAFNALRAPAPPIGGTDGFGDVEDVEPTEPAAPEAGGEEPAPAEPEAPAVVPAIASGAQLDPPPDGDENEHPEAVDLAIDGDPTTFWYSRTYRSATYGMKDGIGYAVTLAEPAVVTTVTLAVNGTGGNVEVRVTDPSTPTEGEVLASGPLGPQTVLTLSTPTEAQHVVLWFTELPQADDGGNRVELAEIALS